MPGWENYNHRCSRYLRGEMYNLEKQFFVGVQGHSEHHSAKQNAYLERFTMTLVLDGCGYYRDATGCETEIYPGLILLRPFGIYFSVQRDQVNYRYREFVINLPEAFYCGLVEAGVLTTKTVAATLVLSDSLLERAELLVRTLEDVAEYNFAPYLSEVIRFIDHVNQLMKGSGDDQGKRLLLKACKMLESNPAKILCMDNVAAELGISARSLRNIFHAGMGTSPKDYRLRYKFEYAGQLLVYTSSSIKEIAFKTGYANAQGFCRQFRRIMGCSPGQYRKRYENTAKA